MDTIEQGGFFTPSHTTAHAVPYTAVRLFEDEPMPLAPPTRPLYGLAPVGERALGAQTKKVPDIDVIPGTSLL